MGKKTQEFYKQIDDAMDRLAKAIDAVDSRVGRAAKARIAVSEVADKITEAQTVANKAYDQYKQDLHFCRYTIENFNKSFEKITIVTQNFEKLVKAKSGDSKTKAASVAAIKSIVDAMQDVFELYLQLKTVVVDLETNLPPVQELLKGRSKDSAPTDSVRKLAVSVKQRADSFKAVAKRGQKAVEELDA